jgi:aminoglycoside/choline kinase family phosphotransferase
MMDTMLAGDEGVTEWVKKSKVIRSVERLPGDASTRRYYRVHTVDSKSYIVMRMEAFDKIAGGGQNLPFLVVRQHLASANVDVPEVLDMDPAKGLILLEDLGDVTLLRRLQDVSNADVERHLYQRVIDSLIDLQLHASPERKKSDIDAYKMRFDHEKLMWEVNFTIENFYQVYLKRNIRKEDLDVMVTGFSEICSFLDRQPLVLTHRDFHSRNIMAVPQSSGVDRLVMIDFQDARLGPSQYDLASLLKDSYYQLEESQIQRLLDYFVIRWEAVSGERLDRAHFEYVFDLMAIQRNFKAIGSFASFLNKRGNATYLKYIGNTFENIRRTLLKYPQYSKLREVLFHYYYF